MKTRKIMTFAAVVALSTTVAFAAPQPGKGGKHGRGARAEFGARFVQQLNLTDAQKEQVKTIRQQFREQNKTFFESSRTTFEQFRAAKKAGDTARVDALKPQLEATRTQMKQLRDQEKAQILSILTPEQRAKYESLKAEREARRGSRGQRHGAGK